MYRSVSAVIKALGGSYTIRECESFSSREFRKKHTFLSGLYRHHQRAHCQPSAMLPPPQIHDLHQVGTPAIHRQGGTVRHYKICHALQIEDWINPKIPKMVLHKSPVLMVHSNAPDTTIPQRLSLQHGLSPVSHHLPADTGMPSHKRW